MRKIFHDATLQESFKKTGYVQVPMLTAEEVASVLAGLAELRPDDNFTPEGRGEKRYRYHCSFLDSNVEYKRQSHNLLRDAFAGPIARHLHGYEILNCNFYVKAPQTGEFPLHQNWPAIADLNDTTVTVWTPLVDVVRSNGALQFVEGSHKLFPHVEGPNCPGFFKDFREAVIEKYLTPMAVKAGESLIFDDGLIHWSDNNASEITRIAVQILCVPSDAQPVYFFYDPQHPERFELIAVDSEWFINTDALNLTVRQPEWRSLGFVPNPNRYPGEEEFLDLMRRGPEIRRQVYGEHAA
jgi:hypothetical protein